MALRSQRTSGTRSATRFFMITGDSSVCQMKTTNIIRRWVMASVVAGFPSMDRYERASTVVDLTMSEDDDETISLFKYHMSSLPD